MGRATIRVISPLRSDLQARARGEYARWAIDRNAGWSWSLLRLLPAVPTVAFVAVVFVLQPNLLGRLYAWCGARFSIMVTPLRGRRRHAAVSLAVFLTAVIGLDLVPSDLNLPERLPLVLPLIVAVFVASANVVAVAAVTWRARGFESPIDHYADTFVRWRFGPGRGKSGQGDLFWQALLQEARTRGWYLGLIANTDEMARKYRRWGMDWDNENDQESRRLVYDGRAKAQRE